jgi:hypothetical protein
MRASSQYIEQEKGKLQDRKGVTGQKEKGRAAIGTTQKKWKRGSAETLEV